MDLINEAHSSGDIKSVEFNSDNVKKITIADAYEEFINEKRVADNLRDSSIKKYDTHFKYLMLFCEKDKLVYTFTNNFFKEIQSKIRLCPANALKVSKYKYKKYDEIMEDFKNSNPIKLSNKSINEIFKSLRHMFEYFDYQNYIVDNTVEFKTLKETTDSYLNFTDTEIDFFLKNNDNILLNHIFRIGLYTGMRIGEIAELKKEHIDFEKGVININYSKTKSGLRVIPIHSELLSIFKFYYNNPIGDYLFIENGNKNILTKNMGKTIRKYFDNSQKVFHSTRKNFAIELYKYEQKNEIKETTIKRLMGHDTSGNITFDIYNLNKIYIDILRESIEKVQYDCLKNISIEFPKILKSSKSSLNLNF